jgi:hypothetical protein
MRLGVVLLASSLAAFRVPLERAAKTVGECVQAYHSMHPESPTGRPIVLMVSGVSRPEISFKHAANSVREESYCVVTLDQDYITDPNILAHEVCHCLSWDFDHMDSRGWLPDVTLSMRQERERVATACAAEVAEKAWRLREKAWRLRVAVAAAKVREWK